LSNASLSGAARENSIWCSPGFAYHWLSPRLSQFVAGDSPIAVELRPMDYGPDFAINEADGDIHHQPKVLAAGECICLASVEGRVMFQGVLARMLGSLVGM